MKNKICIIIFIILIFGITVLSFTTKTKAFSESENRFLEQKPELTVKSLFSGTYSTEYESYITDQFVLRDTWISMKTNTERLLLKQESNGVYFGKDGYLIEKHDASEFKTKQKEKNVKSVAAFAKKMKKRFDQKHLQFLFVPTASEILEDKLPKFAAPYNQSILLKELTKKIGSKYVVNIENTLKKARDEYIYYRTDHHWTMKGAYLSYRKWAKQVGFEPKEESDFDINMVSNSFLGTLSSKVNMKLKADEMYTYDLKEALTYKVTYDASNDVRDSLYDKSALKEKDKYKLYLGGNYGLVEIETNLNTGRKLLVLKDSFAHSFVPFASNHFDTTYMVDLRYFNMGITDFIDQFGITDVLVLYNTVNLVTDLNVWKIER